MRKFFRSFTDHPHSISETYLEHMIAAGYYGLHFSGVWRNTYCVKLETLDNYEFVGPFKTKTELEAEVLKASKQD